MTISELSDADLCIAASSGDHNAEEILTLRYNSLVRACTRPYFLLGGDGEDLIQEGMIGLISAIRSFKIDKDTSFKTYAERCIRNRLISVIRMAQGEKRAPLNDSVSLDYILYEANTADLGKLGLTHYNPEESVIDKESVGELFHSLEALLSKFETKVLELYLDGLSYSAIANYLGRSDKSIDNAVQRIRRKISRHLFPGDVSKS